MRTLNISQWLPHCHVRRGRLPPTLHRGIGPPSRKLRVHFDSRRQAYRSISDKRLKGVPGAFGGAPPRSEGSSQETLRSKSRGHPLAGFRFWPEKSARTYMSVTIASTATRSECLGCSDSRIRVPKSQAWTFD